MARTTTSCAVAVNRLIRLVTGGRDAAMAWNGDVIGHLGSTTEKGPDDVLLLLLLLLVLLLYTP